MDKERERIINEARRIKKEIEQIFIDIEHWNRAVRTPFEKPINPDPDGKLARMLKSLDAMLANEAKPKLVKSG